MVTSRAKLLVEASQLIDGDRNVQYGDPIDDFSLTASMWEDYLRRIVITRNTGGEVFLDPHDVAVMMLLVKVSRLAQSPGKKDHWLDIAGYAGCGWECAEQMYPPS
jgi:hypothetical protein